MLIVLKSGSLNLLEPWGPVQAWNGISLHFICVRNNPSSQHSVLRKISPQSMFNVARDYMVIPPPILPKLFRCWIRKNFPLSIRWILRFVFLISFIWKTSDVQGLLMPYNLQKCYFNIFCTKIIIFYVCIELSMYVVCVCLASHFNCHTHGEGLGNVRESGVTDTRRKELGPCGGEWSQSQLKWPSWLRDQEDIDSKSVAVDKCHSDS